MNAPLQCARMMASVEHLIRVNYSFLYTSRSSNQFFIWSTMRDRVHGKRTPIPVVAIPGIERLRDSPAKWKATGQTDLLKVGAVERRYSEGDALFNQGEECSGLFFIEAGTVAVRIQTDLGNNVLVRLAEAGEVIGTRALIEGGQSAHLKTAEALNDVRAAFVSKESALDVLEIRPGVILSLLRRIAREASEAELSRAISMDYSARARLARMLISLRHHHGWINEHGDLIIKLPVSRKDLASAIGTRPETVSRLIEAFEADRVAFFNARQVRIPDLDDLFDEVEAV